MRSGNPALNDRTFEQFNVYNSVQTMTIEGTATKTGMLLVLTVAAAAITWNQFLNQNPIVTPVMIGGFIVGLIFAIVTCFKPTWSPITSPIYAVAEGLALGGLSAIVESRYPGIAFQAVSLTFGTLFALLIVYRAGWIRATEKFKLGVVAATGGICLVYIVSLVLNLFGAAFPYIHGSGPIGIGFSLFVVVIAALNLVLDFDFIEQGATRGAPKYMEWYGAFGLMVTLIWLYIEILRLVTKLRGRD